MATKGGGSLLGRADTTLTGMSYKQAMADVTPDLGQVYKDEVLTQALFEKGVQAHFDALYADYNALGDELKEATKLMNANLLAGTTPDHGSAELYNSELDKLKQQLKNTPKGKKGDLERTKIRAKLVRLKNSTDDWGQAITTLGTMIENEQGDFQAIGQDLPFLTSIVKGEATKKIDDDGIFYYSMQRDGKEVTMTLPELKEAVVLKDPEFQGNFNKIHPGFNNKGKQKGTIWANERQAAVNAYEDIFTTKHSFATTINHKQGDMEYSFIEGLTGKGGNTTGEIIYKTLMEMGSKKNFYNGYDTDKDGDVDKDDFLNEENGKALINSLTNIKDENFNFQVAKQVAAEFYADGLAAKEFEDGTKLRSKESEREGLTLSYGFRTWGQMKNQYDQINAGKEMIKGGDGTIWNKQSNGKYKHSDLDVIYTPNQLKDHLELNHLDDFAEPEGGYGDINENEDPDLLPELEVPGAENFGVMKGPKQIDSIVNNWQIDYPDFTFERSGPFNNVVTITAPNKKILTTRLGSIIGNKNDQAKAFNEFIEQNKK